MPTREQVLVDALTKIAEMKSFRVSPNRSSCQCGILFACQCGILFDGVPCNYCLMDVHNCAKDALRKVGVDVSFKQ